MLSQEKINLNYATFIEKMKKYNCYTPAMENDDSFNDRLKNGIVSITENSGGAYEGSLVESITRVARIAYSINEMLLPEVKVPLDSLIRVCYLYQISKGLLFTKNDVDWEIKKGKLFKFIDNNPAIKYGEYSLYLCSKFGIELSLYEYEAILSVDKVDDNQTIYFGNMLAQILRSANEIANTERRLNYKAFLEKK